MILNDIVPLIIGVLMVAVFFIHSKKVNKLVENGVEVEGIVYDIITNGRQNSVDTKHPVIRFLTTDELWITETYDIGMLPADFKKGQRVTVIYNAENPKDFMVKFGKSVSYIPLVILVAGILVLSWGLYRIVQYFF